MRYQVKFALSPAIRAERQSDGFTPSQAAGELTGTQPDSGFSCKLYYIGW